MTAIHERPTLPTYVTFTLLQVWLEHAYRVGPSGVGNGKGKPEFNVIPAIGHVTKALEAVRCDAVSGELAKRAHGIEAGVCKIWTLKLERSDYARFNTVDCVAALSCGLPGRRPERLYPVGWSSAAHRGGNWRGQMLARRVQLIDHILAQLRTTTGDC